MPASSDEVPGQGLGGYEGSLLPETDYRRLLGLRTGLLFGALEAPAVGADQQQDDGSEQHEHHCDVDDGVDGLVQPRVV